MIQLTNNLFTKTNKKIMKKIFTLIAMALMAMGVNAQNTWTVSDGFEIEGGKAVSDVENVTLTFGVAEDAQSTAWEVKDAATDLTKQEMTDVLGTTFFVTGDQNPKDDDNNGWKENKGNLPTNGVFYKFELKSDGKLTIGVNIGKSKVMWFVDSSDASKIDSQTAEASANTYGTFTYELKAGTYYLFAAGSKLGFFGFTFEAGEVVEDTGTPHEAQAWDFQSKLSDADKAAINADDNWTIYDITDDETGEVKATCYEYTKKFENAVVKANDTELELTTGLRFNTGASKFQYYDGERLAHGGNGHGPIIPECAKDDEAKIRFKVSQSDRGFDVKNAELTDGVLIGTIEEGEEKPIFEATVKVLKKGDIIFSSVGGADLLGLSVNSELPDLPVEDGISSLAAESSKANKGIFNLAGQQVSKAVKGIYVIGGKKFVVK